MITNKEQWLKRINVYPNQIVERGGMDRTTVREWLKDGKVSQEMDDKIFNTVMELCYEMLDKRRKLRERLSSNY